MKRGKSRRMLSVILAVMLILSMAFQSFAAGAEDQARESGSSAEQGAEQPEQSQFETGMPEILPESTAQAGAPEPAAIETGLNGVQQNLPEVLADNSAQMVLTPVADDYAQDNNGSRDASQLRLKNYPADPGFHRIVYIKYDVSEVAAKTGTDNPDGTLRLYIKGMNSDKLTWFNVYAADSNDWTEGGTMKWEDKPAGKTLLAQKVVADGRTSVPQYIDIPLKNVLAHADAGGLITFQIIIEENPEGNGAGAGSNSGMDFYSKDYGDGSKAPVMIWEKQQPSAESYVELNPQADDYAQDNDGARDASQLRLKNYPADSGFHRIIYMKYDVSEVAARTGQENPDGTLRLYIKDMNSNKLTWFNVYAADSNGWTEGGTMKWADKPAGKTLLARKVVVDGTAGIPEYVDIPLSNILSNADENGLITFQLIIEENPEGDGAGAGSNSGMDFYSKDYADGSKAPVLFWGTKDDPEPEPGPDPEEDKDKFTAVADAFIRGNGDHDGTGPVMTVKKDSEAYSRNGLVRFTVPDDFDITQFNNITLDFFIASTNDSHSRTVLVYAVDNNWNEADVTWETAPVLLQETPVATFEVLKADAGTYVQADVTEYVMGEIAKGNRTFSFKLAGQDVDSKGDFNIATKEADTGHPKIAFHTLTVKEVENPVVDVVLGKTPELPATVDVLLYSGETVKSPVVWDSYQPELLDELGSFTVKGSVPEYGKEAVLTVNVVLPEGYTGISYYVDPNGSDSAEGTSPETAWKSLDKVNATRFLPGDKILLKAGGVWNGQLWPKGSGQEGMPILIAGYGTGAKPVINGNGTGASFTEADNRDASMQYFTGAVQLMNQSYWEIDGLEVTNNDEIYSSNRSGILVYNDGSKGDQTHIQIRNCYVHNCYPTSASEYSGSHKMTGGIIVLGFARNNTGVYSGGRLQLGEIYTTKPAIHDVLIENNTVKDVAKEGIRNKSTGFTSSGGETYPTVSNNVVFRNNYLENIYGDAIVISEVNSGGLVENNIIDTHTQTHAANYAGCWVHYSKDVVFQYNEVFNGKDAYNDGEAFDVDNQCYNTVYQYNYSHDNFGGFLLTMGPQYDSVIRYNVSANDGYGVSRGTGKQQQIFFYWQTAAAGNSLIPEIYNNTIYVGEGVTTELFCGDSGALGADFRNNIVYVEGTLSKLSQKGFRSDCIVENNCLYPLDAFTTAGGWTEGQLTEGNNIFVNPELEAPAQQIAASSQTPSIDGLRQKLSGFRLTEGSPCIDAGQDIVGAPAQDILGNEMIDGRDIGAVEYQKPADTKALEAYVNKVKDTDLSGFTEESVQKYEEALEKAVTLLERTDLTKNDQDLIDDVLAILEAAYEGLDLIPEETTTEAETPSESESTTEGETPSESESTTEGETSSEDESTTEAETPSESESTTENETPPTGDHTSIWFYLMLLAVGCAGAGAAAVSQFRKRTR